MFYKKRAIVCFVGTIDPQLQWTTIGDIMAVYNVVKYLHEHNVYVDLAWSGDVFDLNHLRIEYNDIDPNKYDVFIYVCGPVDSEVLSLASRFPNSKRIAVGVSILDNCDPYSHFNIIFQRDSSTSTTFDLALADIGFPHFHIDRIHKFNNLGICLVGNQGEYGDDCHKQINNLISEATSGLKVTEIQTLLKNDSRHPYSSEIDIQSCDLLLTTRMHGALISAFHGVPAIVIDQIKNGAKVTRIAGKVGFSVINAWTINSIILREVIDCRLLEDKFTNTEWKKQRDNIVEMSRSALIESCDLVMNLLSD